MRILGLLIVGGALVAAGLGAEARTSFSLLTEAGWFNQAYQDRQFLTDTRTSFAVPYAAVGGEVRTEDAEGHVAGFGLAQTTVGAGRVFNYDRWESHPLTVLTAASTFMGRNWGWGEVDLGFGALVDLRTFDARQALGPDGVPFEAQAGGLDWDRRESYAFMTGLVRLFPEAGPHLLLRLARQELSLTENFFNVQAVWPGPAGQFDAELSFSSPLGYWISGPGILRSNERLTLGWSTLGPWGSLGLRVGTLIRPVVAGTGEVEPFHRLSLALLWTVGARPRP